MVLSILNLAKLACCERAPTGAVMLGASTNRDGHVGSMSQQGQLRWEQAPIGTTTLGVGPN
eukprot:2152521-Pyramimonas_sp.AAC.1